MAGVSTSPTPTAARGGLFFASVASPLVFTPPRRRRKQYGVRKAYQVAQVKCNHPPAAVRAVRHNWNLALSRVSLRLPQRSGQANRLTAFSLNVKLVASNQHIGRDYTRQVHPACSLTGNSKQLCQHRRKLAFTVRTFSL